VDYWIKALQDPNTTVRKAAVTKLGNVGATDASAIPALIGALKDKDPHVRCEAILALVKSGNDAKAAIGSLTDLQLHDRDGKVRDYAAKGLKRLQGGGEAQDGAGSSCGGCVAG
jgi:HEAT repeat protein